MRRAKEKCDDTLVDDWFGLCIALRASHRQPKVSRGLARIPGRS